MKENPPIHLTASVSGKDWARSWFFLHEFLVLFSLHSWAAASDSSLEVVPVTLGLSPPLSLPGRLF